MTVTSTTTPPYADRAAGGAEVARQAALRRFTNLVVAAIPLGGVAVARPVADILGGSLEVIGARSIGMVPDVALSVGGVAEDGATVFDPDFQPGFAMMAMIEAAADAARTEIARTAAALRGERPIRKLEGKQVLVVDDAIISPWAVLAAVELARHRGATRVAVAAPAGAEQAVERLELKRIEVICPVRSAGRGDLTAWYGDASPPDEAEAEASLLRVPDR